MAYRAVVAQDPEWYRRGRERAIKDDAQRYLMAHNILMDLRSKYLRKRIDYQQYKTLRGQALAGDISGAEKGLAHILARKERGWEV